MAITIDGVVYRNLEDQVQYLTEMYEDLYNISTYMPSDVSTQNKLATRAYVDQSVTTVSAHYLTSDTEGNNFATKASLLSGPYYYGLEEHDPDENDYAFVNADETHDDLPSRYVFIGDEWKYQYSLSSSSGVVDLTSDQTITGTKTFSKGIYFNSGTYVRPNNDFDIEINSSGGTIWFSRSVKPIGTGKDLGAKNARWKGFYLTEKIDLVSTSSVNWQITGSQYDGIYIQRNGSNLYVFETTGFNPTSNNVRDLGSTNLKWRDLYLSGEIVGSYKEANTVTYSSGNYVASFTSIDSTTVNKIKYIEVTLEGTNNCVSFNVPVAAINMSEHSVNYEIKTNGYPVESIFILYMSNTLSIAVPHTDSTYTAHIFIKFH